MDRRLLLAIALSFLFLLSWSTLTSRLHPVDNKEVTITDTTASVKPVSPVNVITPPKISPQNESSLASFKVAREKTEITFIEPYAAIKEVKFKDYQDYELPLKHAFLFGGDNLVFTKKEISDKEVSFAFRDQDKEIIKRFLFPNSSYYMELEIEISNLSNKVLPIDLPLTLGVLDFSRDQNQMHFQDITVSLPEKPLHLDGRKDSNFNQVEFMGLRDRYFCLIVEPERSRRYGGWIQKINPQESGMGLRFDAATLNPGQQIKYKFRIYLGPQELRTINAIEPNWSIVMHYGVFNVVAHALLQVLDFIYRIVHNWGLAVIILSILIYFLFYPLTLKQMHSMKQMQALQPTIEGLRKTYKDNPQKLNKEIMELYRKHKVNPFGGCLPMLLQLPVFFALYQALIRSISLKGASFLWIKDLSAPDKLFTLPVNLPLLGNEINILPIIMAIGMFFQQKMSMGAATSGSAEQQKIMAILFPIIFGFIFYHMPSGIVLYWFVNSALMLIYQLRTTRLK